MQKEKPKQPVRVRHHTVLDIIQACKEAGVTSFRDGDLEILFSVVNQSTIENTQANQYRAPEENFQIEPIEKSKDDVLFDLCVADPIAFEEIMMKESDG